MISREGHLAVDDCWHTYIKGHRTNVSKGQTHPLCVPRTKAREESTKKYHELSKLHTYDQGLVVGLCGFTLGLLPQLLLSHG